MIDLLLSSVLILSMLVIGLTSALLGQRQRQTQTQKQLQNLQDDLKQQLQTLDTILSASPDQFYMFAPDRRFIYANRAALQSLKLQKSDVIGKTEQDLGFPPYILEQHKTRLDTVFATGEPITGEICLQMVDAVRQVEYLLIPILDASGNVQVVVATSRDITQRKQVEEELSQYRLHLEDLVAARTVELAKTIAERDQEIIERQRIQEALKESEERWLLALRGNNDGIWDWNLKTNEVFFSARWKEMLGYKDDEIANHFDEWALRVHPDDLGWVTQAVEDHLAKKTPFYITEHRVLCKDGTYKWILDRGQVLWDDQGNAVRMVGSHTDITERKQAEQELRRQSQYRQLLAEIALRIRESLQIEVILQTTVTELQNLLQADRVLFYRFLANCHGKVVAEAVVNGWPSTLGRELEDHCFEAQYLKQYQQTIHAWSDVEEAGFQDCHLEMLRQFNIRANLIVPIFLKDKIWGLLFVQQCSTPREWNLFEVELLGQLADQLSIALAQAQLLEKETRHSQELARSNEELQQFASVVSHDLQEPLRTITSYAKLLSRRYQNQFDAKANRFIQYLIDESLRMQTLINDLLWYSKVGRQAQNFGLCDCAAVLDVVINRLEEAITNSDAQIIYDNLPTILADQTQLIQLFQNLISNALKYRRSLAPVIQIAAQCQEGEWLFSVRDNGIGIDPKYGERIFAIFQRLHTQEEYSGTGIGLAIAAKIVERHNGRIWVESSPGEGATFYFTIPEAAVSDT